MRLFTDVQVNGRVQHVLPTEPQTSLAEVMERMLASYGRISKKSAMEGLDFVGKEIWLPNEFGDHALQQTIDAEINDL